MKFLLDQDVYVVTERFLRSLNFDILTAAEIGLSRAPDIELLHKAQQLDRILITRDKDYSELVFVKNLHCGVIFLRVLPSTLQSVHRELQTVLLRYSEEQLRSSFIVVEGGRHRIRKLSN
jgi:predicted nuclease of predicted toxin-antitoxin system